MATLASLCVASCFLLTPLYLLYKPPSLVISYFERRWPDVLWHVSTSKSVVALTIDDGPSECTAEIMSILKANGATATFFLIGSHVPGHEDILQQLIRNGNELGNHAMHDEPARSLSDATLVAQIEAVHKIIHDTYTVVGVDPPPRYFRPGSGFFSTRMRNVLAELSYKLVLGNIYPHDPQIPFSRLNANHILTMCRPGGIIICHDGRHWTAPMLREVLSELRRRDYRVVTISELLKEQHCDQTRFNGLNDKSL